MGSRLGCSPVSLQQDCIDSSLSPVLDTRGGFNRIWLSTLCPGWWGQVPLHPLLIAHHLGPLGDHRLRRITGLNGPGSQSDAAQTLV